MFEQRSHSENPRPLFCRSTIETPQKRKEKKINEIGKMRNWKMGDKKIEGCDRRQLASADRRTLERSIGATLASSTSLAPNHWLSAGYCTWAVGSVGT